MIRKIVRDPLFLAQRSLPASAEDRQAAADLLDTLRACLDRCAGMAANMIGVRKRIIAFCDGPVQAVMFNPEIVARSGPYEAEEGCLSLAGTPLAKDHRPVSGRGFPPPQGQLFGLHGADHPA